MAKVKHILLVFNPLARSGRAAKDLPAIRQAFEQKQVTMEILKSANPGEIRQCLARFDFSAFDAVVAAGGDGTLFEVVNGLMLQAVEQRPPLGVIPIGTGNAFARDIGLSGGDWKTAVEKICGGQFRRIDLGQLSWAGGQYYFLNVVGFGLVVDAARTAGSLKGVGRLAYTLGALWQMLKLRSFRLKLQCDEVVLEQETLLVEISNSRYTGTSFLMAPAAKLDDGLLDLTLVRKVSRLRLLRLFPTIYSGKHVEHEEVSVLQGSYFQISSPASYVLLADGEFSGQTPAEIRSVPAAIRIFY
jgi:YegS/Rv2252/BmrU family lipid kinase